MGDLSSYGNNYEMALFCSQGKPKLKGERKKAIWEINVEAGSEYVHPTQKPITLSAYAIPDFINENDLVDLLKLVVNIEDFNLFGPRTFISGCVKIGKYNTFHLNSSVIQNLTIGDRNTINLYSCLFKSINDDGVYFGVPAMKQKF
jgi:hypothetical protein